MQFHLFVGFLQARIPLGVTFSYLISAPLGDAVVIAMLFSIFGLKITLFYIGFALLIAICAGLLIGALNLEKEVLIEVKPLNSCCNSVENNQTTLKAKVKESFEYTKDIFKKLYIYVIIGIAIGAFIHGICSIWIYRKICWWRCLVCTNSCSCYSWFLCTQMQLEFYQ